MHMILLFLSIVTNTASKRNKPLTVLKKKTASPLGEAAFNGFYSYFISKLHPASEQDFQC